MGEPCAVPQGSPVLAGVEDDRQVRPVPAKCSKELGAGAVAQRLVGEQQGNLATLGAPDILRLPHRAGLDHGMFSPCQKPRGAGANSVVVVHHAGQHVGLVVDSLLGEFQTVIKPLSRVFEQVQCISGSTILGNGQVALIVDAASLIEANLGRDPAAAAGRSATSALPAAAP